MLAAEPPAPGCGDGRRRGHGRNEIAEAIDEAALDIDGMEDGAVGNNVGDALQQRVGLCGLFDIAAEEHGAGRLDQAQPGALGGVEFRSGKSDKE